jgi:hypothetical protein
MHNLDERNRMLPMKTNKQAMGWDCFYFKFQQYYNVRISNGGVEYSVLGLN